MTPMETDVLGDILLVLSILGICISGLRWMIRNIVRDEMKDLTARVWAIGTHLGID